MPTHEPFLSNFVHFVTDRTLPLWFDDEDVSANARRTLRLEST